MRSFSFRIFRFSIPRTRIHQQELLRLCPRWKDLNQYSLLLIQGRSGPICTAPLKYVMHHASSYHIGSGHATGQSGAEIWSHDYLLSSRAIFCPEPLSLRMFFFQDYSCICMMLTPVANNLISQVHWCHCKTAYTKHYKHRVLYKQTSKTTAHPTNRTHQVQGTMKGG